MQKNLKKITHYFKKLIGGECQIINPSRDWVILLGFFLFIVIFFISVNSYLFLKIYNNSFDNSYDTSISLDVINRSGLDLVINAYKVKADNFEVLKITNIDISDPSM